MNINTQLVHKVLLQARQVSPTAMTVAGVIGIVGATVMACRATLKVQPVLEEIEVGLEVVEENRELLTTQGDRVYSQKDIGVQKLKTVAHGAWDLTVLYAPAVVIGTISIAAIAGGHGILLKRNAALAGALTVTEKAFDNYRKAVAAEIGEDREKEIRYGKTVERIDDTKKGEVKEVVTFDPNKRSPYARFFDEYSKNWDRNADYNRMFILAQQEYATQRLKRQGYLLLNDVYEALGFEPTSAGAVVGWALGHGDDYVDFGLNDWAGSPEREAFLNGDERSVLLDFNVAGVVYHMIGVKL